MSDDDEALRLPLGIARKAALLADAADQIERDTVVRVSVRRIVIGMGTFMTASVVLALVLHVWLGAFVLALQITCVWWATRPWRRYIAGASEREVSRSEYVAIADAYDRSRPES